jgi:hypothetical protein
VQTSAVTYGTMLLSLAFAAGAWLFDDPALAAIAGILVLFVLARGFLFVLDLRELTGSLGFSREADKEIVRQGGTVPVTAWFRLPARLLVRATDIPPRGSAVKSGTTTAAARDGRAFLSYEIRMMAGGDARFPGADLSVRDPFFGEEIRCGAVRFRGPVIHVEPFSPFAPAETIRTIGDEESEEIRVLPGHGVRSFREYADGDDPRDIDWKLSAKHDKLFIREYGSTLARPPLIVLDLPPGGDGADSLKGAVLRLAEESATGSGGGEILVVSGANVLRSVRFGVHTKPVRAALAVKGDGSELVHFYRYIDASSVRLLGRRSESFTPVTPGDRAFLSKLSGVCGAFASGAKPAAFVTQVRRVLTGATTSDLYVFSTFSGDTSHLWQVVLHARRRGFQVFARIPKAMATPDRMRTIARADFDGVGVLP